jgi:multiple sugar transport system permease protein
MNKINSNQISKLLSNRKVRKILKVDFWANLLWSIFRFVLVVGIAFMILYPIIVKCLTAIKSTSDLFDPTVLLIPKNPTLENVSKVIDAMDYLPTLLITFGFTLMNALLQTLACTVTAYGLARFKYKLRSLFFILVIVTLIVPPQTILLPLLIQFQHFSFMSLITIIPSGKGIDLTNSIFPFIFTSVTALGLKNGLFIYMLRQNFINMPVALEEAAYIDGCGAFKTFYKIMLPNGFNMMITVFLFSFVWLWNDSLYISFFADKLNFMASAITKVSGIIQATEWSGVADPSMTVVYNNVAIVLHILPLMVLYIFAQKYFIQSVEKSGIVG